MANITLSPHPEEARSAVSKDEAREHFVENRLVEISGLMVRDGLTMSNNPENVSNPHRQKNNGRRRHRQLNVPSARRL
jgi:hypothetical protein